MFYSKFTIEFYKSFKSQQSMKFGIPIEGNVGSGITYLVGENNSGKTTIAEGLFLKNNGIIRNSELQSDGSPCFQLFDVEENLKRKVELLRAGNYRLKEDPSIGKFESFEILSSRRHWQSDVRGISTTEEVARQTINNSPRSRSEISISDALSGIESDDEKFAEFISLVQRVIPEFQSFAIAFEEKEYVEYVTKNGIKHRTDFLGDGVISILRILVHLFNQSDRPLIIDEPELSLHPLAQKRLLHLIADFSQKRQIIIMTHSPYLVSWDYIKKGATLNKIIKHDDQESKIYTMQDFSAYEALINGSNWQQPFLMDVVAKEIFFHDNFLFVEGQEDVGLIKADGQLDEIINLFGYGVRGKNSFNLALQLAKDLGVRKACAILDAGEDEDEVKKELEAKYSDDDRYLIIQWNREDIRDKEAYESKEKEGYFDAKGNKKNTEDLDDYEEKIQNINDYFSK